MMPLHPQREGCQHSRDRLDTMPLFSPASVVLASPGAIAFRPRYGAQNLAGFVGACDLDLHRRITATFTMPVTPRYGLENLRNSRFCLSARLCLGRSFERMIIATCQSVTSDAFFDIKIDGKALKGSIFREVF